MIAEGVKDALLGHLVGKHEAVGAEDCEVVGFSGEGRCVEPSVALRWEDGHTDLVCQEHAERAEERGALVVYP